MGQMIGSADSTVGLLPKPYNNNSIYMPLDATMYEIWAQ